MKSEALGRHLMSTKSYTIYVTGPRLHASILMGCAALAISDDSVGEVARHVVG